MSLKILRYGLRNVPLFMKQVNRSFNSNNILPSLAVVNSKGFCSQSDFGHFPTRDDEKPPIVAEKVKGTVKWFSVEKGYGFLQRNDNGQDLMVHYSAILRPNLSHRVKSLDDGETVLFDIANGKDGRLCAMNVTGPDGGSVRGAPMADQYTFGVGSMKRKNSPFGGQSQAGPRDQWRKNSTDYNRGYRGGGAGSDY